MLTCGAVPGPEPHLDHRGSRRLSGVEEWFWYLLAGATYILVAIWHKFVLNWIVGPLWLVAVASLGPALGDRIRRLLRRKPA